MHNQFKTTWGKESATEILRLGDVTSRIKVPKNAELVPKGYVCDTKNLPQTTLKHLRWLLQKDQLKQDVFLIGQPGSTRRRLVMQYLEITKNEYEYLALTRDITESDIKQRREIRAGSAYYVEQAAIRAAIKGRVLVLDGIEKAERNVLPILNNLLENREVQLDDGRFLLSPEKYDKLLLDHTKEELKKFQLVRVNENFRVIALGLPVPKFRGHTLDPPLRSRFQSRNVDYLNFKEHYDALYSLAPSISSDKLAELLSFVYSLLAEESSSLGLPEFPVDNLTIATRVWQNFNPENEVLSYPNFSGVMFYVNFLYSYAHNSNPDLSANYIIELLYPYSAILKKEGQDSVKNAMDTFNLLDKQAKKPKTVKSTVASVTPLEDNSHVANVKLLWNNKSILIQAIKGCNKKLPENLLDFIPAQSHERLLSEMILSHGVHDFCLIGPKGCGKSTLVSKFAELFDYDITSVMLYQDMTSRDLVQQRRMLPNGDTVWQHSPLIEAALNGGLAVLDGIHRVHHSTLNILNRLVHDREIELFDGTRLMHKDRYDLIRNQYSFSDTLLQEKKILPIHPSFRIIALAEPPNVHDSSQQWLTPELLTLFLYHQIKPLSVIEEMQVVAGIIPSVAENVEESLLNFVQKLRNNPDSNIQSLAGSLSTRQLLRIMKRLTKYPEECLNTAINKACLSRFLPQLTKASLNQALAESNIVAKTSKSDKPKPISYASVDDKLIIGNTTARINQPENRTLVPDILFYDNIEHVRIIEDMLRDYLLGEHLLLVGNQGVGKNKVADKFLQLLNLPRQYIQLHRDTTVQTLTLQATMQDGVLTYEDSPLVKAVKNGQILVIDEGDKAPTHVTCILKSLLESNQMYLADGRKIVPFDFSGEFNEKIIRMHPDFRIIVLANRPGFPFLGNDFYGALGDLFACHAVDNPSMTSEIEMLKKYGPDVPVEVLRKLASAFSELRDLADQNLLTYPYSTRELVNIVKHLQKFPNEGLATVVGNVFDFDAFTKDAQETIVSTLNKHGITFGKATKFEIILCPKFPLPGATKIGSWGYGLSSSKATNVSLDYVQSSIEFANPLPFSPRTFDVDRLDMRSDKFSEQTAYWQLPINDVNIVSDVVASSASGDIYVATVNPISLYRINPILKFGSFIEFYYDFFPTSKGYFKPRVTLATLNTVDRSDNWILLHEEMTNTLLLIDTIRKQVNVLHVDNTNYQKLFGKVAQTLYGGDTSYYRMLTEMSSVNGTVIVYQKNGSTIDLKNFNEMINRQINLPFKIDECFWSSPTSLILTTLDTDKRQIFYSLDFQENNAKLKVLQTSYENSVTIRGMSTTSTNQDLVAQALSQQYLAPNRMLYESSGKSYGVITMGFPELDSGELFDFSKSNERLVSVNQPYWAQDASLKILNPSAQYCALPVIGQLVKALPYWKMPAKAVAKDTNLAMVSGFLEVVDFPNRQVFYIPVPGAKYVSPYTSWLSSLMETTFVLSSYGKEGVVTADVSGGVRMWETSTASLRNSEAAWQKMIGANQDDLQLTVEKDDADLSKLTDPTHGITDPTGAPHQGGSMFAGGVGGYNTAGLGGVGGPYRLDLGHQVQQLPDFAKDQVPEHIRKKAREMAQRAYKQRLKDIQMSEFEAELYEKFHGKVEKQVTRLRIIIDSLQAKGKERQWVRHQTSGDLDEGKLIEGITGEKSIYRKRAEKEPEPGSPQQKPKWMRICPDVSGSMYRFNGYDGRLERTLEACLMVMEALEGYEQKIKYEIVGHSGEEPIVGFSDPDKPPKNKKERLDVLKTMLAHSQFCVSGDYTLEATKLAVDEMVKKDADERFVIVLSDANLDRYGIKPSRLAEIMTADESVNVFAIFIGSLGDQANVLKKRLPAGKAFVCKTTSEIPQIMQQIFTSTIAAPSS